MSPGVDAPRVAGSFPNPPRFARWVRETSSRPRCVQSRTHRTCKYVCYKIFKFSSLLITAANGPWEHRHQIAIKTKQCYTYKRQFLILFTYISWVWYWELSTPTFVLSTKAEGFNLLISSLAVYVFWQYKLFKRYRFGVFTKTEYIFAQDGFSKTK